MNSALLELALRKQRLQLQSAALRADFAACAAAFAPAAGLVDRAREGLRWLRNHPGAVAALAATLVALRPRTVFRWTRRGLLAWQATRKLSDWLGAAKR